MLFSWRLFFSWRFFNCTSFTMVSQLLAKPSCRSGGSEIRSPFAYNNSTFFLNNVSVTHCQYDVSWWGLRSSLSTQDVPKKPPPLETRRHTEILMLLGHSVTDWPNNPARLSEVVSVSSHLPEVSARKSRLLHVGAMIWCVIFWHLLYGQRCVLYFVTCSRRQEIGYCLHPENNYDFQSGSWVPASYIRYLRRTMCPSINYAFVLSLPRYFNHLATAIILWRLPLRYNVSVISFIDVLIQNPEYQRNAHGSLPRERCCLTATSNHWNS